MQKYICAQLSLISTGLTRAQGFLQRNAIPAIFTILHSNALGYNAPGYNAMHSGTLHMGRHPEYAIYTIKLVKYIIIH